jgi:hypothetical protein
LPGPLIAMSTVCPFCAQENAVAAFVCSTCSRDIAVPAQLIDERNDLFRKRDAAREELSRARGELDALKRDKKNRPV